MIDRLANPIKDYAWGSRTLIATLTDRPAPSPGLEAEMWLGAHPSGPSALMRDGNQTTLDRLIAANPIGELGEKTVKRFGPRLPYLKRPVWKSR
ncbi:type I phosphomannose isomerase catalytic subunit [Streptosporangium sp. G11]|uniref:type I phosphomannose isomerase catalytic subunit n=1 Tax=Streptosporangium sp. G11 TaxID=3436926 RepID=UPI003EBEBA11